MERFVCVRGGGCLTGRVCNLSCLSMQAVPCKRRNAVSIQKAIYTCYYEILNELIHTWITHTVTSRTRLTMVRLPWLLSP